MSIRTLLLLILIVPAFVIGGAWAMGMKIPVPQLGRDYVLSFVIDQEQPVFELPSIQGNGDPQWPLVVIDAGHGGDDPGSISGGVREKDIVLAIAKALRDKLLSEGGVRVAMTRNDDIRIPNLQRPEIARQLGADLFLSIHADSAGDRDDVTGATIYTLSLEASSEAAARFAARENASDAVNGVQTTGQSDQVNSILVELSQQRTQDDATEFASLIEREGQGKIAFHPQTQRSAELIVLRSPDVPGVLFESGFVTNASDRAQLTSEEGRSQYADVLARAIRVYFARRADL